MKWTKPLSDHANPIDECRHERSLPREQLGVSLRRWNLRIRASGLTAKNRARFGELGLKRLNPAALNRRQRRQLEGKQICTRKRRGQDCQPQTCRHPNRLQSGDGPVNDGIRTVSGRKQKDRKDAKNRQDRQFASSSAPIHRALNYIPAHLAAQGPQVTRVLSSLVQSVYYFLSFPDTVSAAAPSSG